VSGTTMVMLELMLVFGVVMGWGVWELYKLKKDK
jgi:hypothetical protein